MIAPSPLLPEKLPNIPNDKLDLSSLPSELAARLEDMWRLNLLNDYPRVLTARDHLRKSLGELYHFAFQCLLDPQQQHVLPQNGQERLAKLQELYHAGVAYYVVPVTPAFDVNRFYKATVEDCSRLTCECQLALFHSALESLPKAEKNAIGDNYPLIHCMRRARNFTLHHRPLDTTQRDFEAKLIDEGNPNDRPIKINFAGSWFLVVEAESLAKTEAPKRDDWFLWFQNICSKHPVWWLLQAAEVYLVDYFRAKKSPPAS
jgi:hypothetical protein